MELEQSDLNDSYKLIIKKQCLNVILHWKDNMPPCYDGPQLPPRKGPDSNGGTIRRSDKQMVTSQKISKKNI